MVALQTINSIFNYYDAFRQEDSQGPHAAEARKASNRFLGEEIAKVKMCNEKQETQRYSFMVVRLKQKNHLKKAETCNSVLCQRGQAMKYIH